jgi:uncharacterized damage-inducible protein DinB
MYRRIDDFTRSWEMESANTLKVLRSLTDPSLAQPIAEGHLTLGGLAWHLTGALATMLRQAELSVDGPVRGDAMPTSADSIVSAYEDAARSVAQAVPSSWTDESLTENAPFYGRSLPRGVILNFLILHQTHHRGQMTVLMRQAGLRVPGVYGPAKEEMEAMMGSAAAS